MVQQLTQNIIHSLFKPRKKDVHKGTFGHALLIAGSTGKMGAAILAARACLRTGCGLLTVNIPPTVSAIFPIAIPEAMVLSREESNFSLLHFDAIGIGPGMGISEESSNLLLKILHQQCQRVVMDADALSILAENNNHWKSVPLNTILTPHPKEFDRMFGMHNSLEDRISTAQKICKEYGWIIVLKGFQTHIIDKENIYQNTNGNSGLAKGGTGDLLTGMITALLAQKYLPIHAACLAVFLHGAAADLCLHTQSNESMLATDVIENIGNTFKLIASGKPDE